MRLTTLFSLAATMVVLSATTATAQLSNFLQDFEGLDRTDPNVLVADGFVFFASSTGGTPAFPDFTFFSETGVQNNIESPNITVVSDVPSGGDPPAGNQGLVFFTDTASGLFLDSTDSDPRDLLLNIFQQQTISEADIGSTVTFDFLAEQNAFPPTGDALVEGFLLTLDPNNGFALTNEDAVDITATPDSPTGFQLSLELTDPALVGQTLQFGFRNSASDLEGSGIDLDNLAFVVTPPGGVAPTIPEPSSMVLLALGGVALITKRRRNR